MKLMQTIENLRGHLGAAKVQRAPSDDAIIAEHIDAAYDLALNAERMIENGGNLRTLLDAADDALDKDTYDQIQREELDLPDDAEVWITAGTRTKINRLFAVLDRTLKDEGK